MGLVLMILVFSSLSFSSVPSIKVLIGKSLKDVVVEGIDLKKIFHLRKENKQYSGRKTITFNCRPSRQSRIILPTKQLVASLSSPTGLISWGRQKFQGELHLVSQKLDDGCDLVDSIPLEAYITTLLAKEMHGSWPVEALKAQAVAARTYAYERVKRASPERVYDLESSEKDQVSGTFFDVTENTLKASKETEGEILVSPSGKVSPAFFHSKCGGQTFRPDQVWGGTEEGYRSVDCPFCQKTGRKDWAHELKSRKLIDLVDQVLKKHYSQNLTERKLKLLPDEAKNSEIRFYSADKFHVIKKSYLRHFVGREILPSNNYVMSAKNNIVKVEGQGYGHGVGLCQLGALELAKRGYDYRQILSHYFPKHKIRTVYTP